MNPCNEETVITTAIRKLASDLRSMYLESEAAPKVLKANAPDASSSIFVDISLLIDYILGKSTVAAEGNFWSSLLKEMAASSDYMESVSNSFERSRSAYEQAKNVFEMHHHYGAWESALDESLQRTANFSSCIGKKFEKVQRRDALIIAGSLIDAKACIVSMNYVENALTLKARDVLCDVDATDKLSSILVFEDIEHLDIYASILAKPNFDQNENWRLVDDNTAAESKRAKFIVFVDQVSPAETKIAKDDESSDTEKISSSRARDLFYGKVKSRAMKFSHLQAYYNDVGNPLRLWDSEDLILSPEKFQTWKEEYVQLSDDMSDALGNEELISSQRAVVMFFGRKLLKNHLSHFFEVASKTYQGSGDID
jgi:hypothetical protein